MFRLNGKPDGILPSLKTQVLPRRVVLASVVGGAAVGGVLPVPPTLVGEGEHAAGDGGLCLFCWIE